MDLLFRLCNILVLPFWALMIFLPRWRRSARILQSPLVSVGAAIVYAALVLPRLGEIWPAVAQPTLAGVAALLSSPAAVTIAWVHLLAFDLFVGRWIYLDSRERGLSSWLISPVLFLTLMLGPAGFLSYLVVRALAPYARKPEPQNRSLMILGVIMVGTFLATVVGVFADHHVITGAPAWLKPAKFAISVSIYCFTLVWLLSFIHNRPRLVRIIANVTTASLIVEMIAIITQAARGTTSHFNMSTPFNAVVWSAMGTFVTLVWIMGFLAAIALLRQRMADAAFAWSLRLGVIISLVGMAAAIPMTVLNAHSVGVADGGPGIPILGWSTLGGDLRVAHFVGLHALQVMPFLGWWFSRRGVGNRLALVWTGGLAYLGFVLLLLWQALRGQSVVHPDLATVVAMAALVAAALFSLFAVNLRQSRKHSRAVAEA